MKWSAGGSSSGSAGRLAGDDTAEDVAVVDAVVVVIVSSIEGSSTLAICRASFDTAVFGLFVASVEAGRGRASRDNGGASCAVVEELKAATLRFGGERCCWCCWKWNCSIVGRSMKDAGRSCGEEGIELGGDRVFCIRCARWRIGY